MKLNEIKHCRLTRDPIGTSHIKDLSSGGHTVVHGRDSGLPPPHPVVLGKGGKLVRITTLHHCMANTGRILDMVGPYRVSGEPTVLYFILFHVDGVKM